MNRLLNTVMTQGTGRYYALNGIECIGKTGTTTESYDRWFMGGTPEYIGGIWYGYDENKEVVYSLSYNPAGTLWNSVMKQIYDKKSNPVKEFTLSDGVVRREYSSNGGLYSGSGNWGWFDVNNLPRQTDYHDYGNKTTSSSRNSNNSETKRNDNETTAADGNPSDGDEE